MSDAISHSKHQPRLWNEARKLTCMYFDYVPISNDITKDYIEEWLSKYGRTPDTMKSELEELGLMWWHVSIN